MAVSQGDEYFQRPHIVFVVGIPLMIGLLVVSPILKLNLQCCGMQMGLKVNRATQETGVSYIPTDLDPFGAVRFVNPGWIQSTGQQPFLLAGFVGSLQVGQT